MIWTPMTDWQAAFAGLPVMTVGGRIVWLREYQTRTLECRYNDGHDHKRQLRRSSQNRLMPEEADMWRYSSPRGTP